MWFTCLTLGSWEPLDDAAQTIKVATLRSASFMFDLECPKCHYTPGKWDPRGPQGRWQPIKRGRHDVHRHGPTGRWFDMMKRLHDKVITYIPKYHHFRLWISDMKLVIQYNLGSSSKRLALQFNLRSTRDISYGDRHAGGSKSRTFLIKMW